ncbi:MAG: hypothetical protein RMJ43_07190 [Chloroherpetonaceae bacterium]|nr:hypothetical protein [Chloroherpetonaceae bacterium]
MWRLLRVGGCAGWVAGCGGEEEFEEEEGAGGEEAVGPEGAVVVEVVEVVCGAGLCGVEGGVRARGFGVGGAEVAFFGRGVDGEGGEGLCAVEDGVEAGLCGVFEEEGFCCGFDCGFEGLSVGGADAEGGGVGYGGQGDCGGFFGEEGPLFVFAGREGFEEFVEEWWECGLAGEVAGVGFGGEVAEEEVALSDEGVCGGGGSVLEAEEDFGVGVWFCGEEEACEVDACEFGGGEVFEELEEGAVEAGFGDGVVCAGCVEVGGREEGEGVSVACGEVVEGADVREHFVSGEEEEEVASTGEVAVEELEAVGREGACVVEDGGVCVLEVGGGEFDGVACGDADASGSVWRGVEGVCEEACAGAGGFGGEEEDVDGVEEVECEVAVVVCGEVVGREGGGDAVARGLLDLDGEGEGGGAGREVVCVRAGDGLDGGVFGLDVEGDGEGAGRGVSVPDFEDDLRVLSGERGVGSDLEVGDGGVGGGGWRGVEEEDVCAGGEVAEAFGCPGGALEVGEDPEFAVGGGRVVEVLCGEWERGVEVGASAGGLEGSECVEDGRAFGGGLWEEESGGGCGEEEVDVVVGVELLEELECGVACACDGGGCGGARLHGEGEVEEDEDGARGGGGGGEGGAVRGFEEGEGDGEEEEGSEEQEEWLLDAAEAWLLLEGVAEEAESGEVAGVAGVSGEAVDEERYGGEEECGPCAGVEERDFVHGCSGCGGGVGLWIMSLRRSCREMMPTGVLLRTTGRRLMLCWSMSAMISARGCCSVTVMTGVLMWSRTLWERAAA